MAETPSENSVDLQKLRSEAETLILQFDELADALARYKTPDDAPLKAGQLREISKTINNLENQKIPVPDELRNLKTDLLSQTHQFEEAENIFTMVEQELAKIVVKVRKNIGVNSANGERRARRNSGDVIARTVLRECVVKSLKAHGGRAKTALVLDEVGEMLVGKLSAGDQELDDNSRQPIWRRNTCMERRVMVRDGILKDETNGGCWELTSRFAATLAK